MTTAAIRISTMKPATTLRVSKLEGYVYGRPTGSQAGENADGEVQICKTGTM